MMIICNQGDWCILNWSTFTVFKCLNVIIYDKKNFFQMLWFNYVIGKLLYMSAYYFIVFILYWGKKETANYVFLV